MEQDQNRFTSPVVWSTIAAQVLAILVALGVIDTGMSEVIEGLVVALLEALTVFGVLNNPTNKTGF